MGHIPPCSAAAAGTTPTYEPVIIAGAPDYDPNGVYASLVDNGAGSYTFGINNTTAVNGAGEGAIWVASMPTGWADDATKLVPLRLTVETSAPDNVDFWVGLGVCDLTGNASNVGSDPMVAGVMRQSAADQSMTQTRTSLIIKAGSGGTVTCDMIWVPGGVLSALDDMGTISIRSVETGIETSRTGGAAADGNVRVIVTAGCFDAGATGPHLCTVKLEMGLLSKPS